MSYFSKLTADTSLCQQSLMSNFMEEKNIMAESSHLSPKSSEPEPNINKHLVESPTQSDPISDELVKSSQIFGHNMLVESDSIIDELVGSPPQSYPIDDELMESSSQSYPIADESAESHQQFEPIADELVDSLSQTDPITNEFVKSPLLSDPMIDENNKTPPTEEGGQSELGDAMMTPKKKRGRPRKYEVNEEMAFDILASNMEGTSKSSKGPRKSSSNKLQWLATNGREA
uniref:uncharacterized protein LOC105350406 isoform X2 n=1 Tax=Fragaria vesca subsp. vesca TaxID=101020 RepID=UPI0005CABE83|nr:PREDICTED: uncharacterized protein LOC105350406 isoform X2 [Fragaria vesca subsp. vesca]